MQKELGVNADRGFAEWLQESGGSLAVSTYQAGKLLMIGSDQGQLRLLPRHFDKPMGLAVKAETLALATKTEVILFANAPTLAATYLPDKPGYYDALYLPRVSYHTNELNLHDLAFVADDLWAVNTRFNCLAKLNANYNFEPAWAPSFISALVPEDRCHLNGLAVSATGPAYVTCLGMVDIAGGWRQNKSAGGVLIDVQSGEVVLGDLAMPHSPRLHQGDLYVLNSGAGELLKIDAATGQKEIVCVLPGYARGLDFMNGFALVGLSMARESDIFGGLLIQKKFTQLHCGVAVVDLQTGELRGLFEFTAGCEEVYDLRFLVGACRPSILNLNKPASREAMVTSQQAYWLRTEVRL